MEKEKKINELNEEISKCQKCELYKTRIQTVPGNGGYDVDIMVVAEAPGQSEDEQGIPLCGRCGRLYNAWLIKELNLNRKDVFTTNILKCRPPNNRDPKSEEAECCRSFLDRQIEIIQPKIIITLGRIAAINLLNDSWFKITKHHGRWRKYKDIPVMPIYHPSYLLRQMSAKNKEAVKNDFKLVINKLKSEKLSV